MHRLAAEKADSEQLALRTAEKLLREMKPRTGDLRHTILENMALVATRHKGNVEKALAAFMSICSNEVGVGKESGWVWGGRVDR